MNSGLNKIIRDFLIKKINNGYTWNSIAGVVSASEAVILSMVITRTIGLADAGILTIAFAVGNLFLNIGKFGVRNYQISDIKGEFSFSNYFIARLISTGSMLLVSVIYLIVRLWEENYSWQKAIVVFGMCAIYAIEAIEDVFCGLYQQNNALDVGAKIFSIRWILTMIIMSLSLLWWHDLLKTMLAGVLTSGIAFIYLLYLTYPSFKKNIRWGICKKDFGVLRNCLPLFLSGFMMFYITNAPKYSIDRWLTEEVQACYGFIAMPVFVIEVLNGLIYYPIVVKMSIEWEERNKKRFLRSVYKQCLILLGIICICLIGAYTLGIPILSMLYATDLSDYKIELLILLFGGGMLATIGFFNTLITIMRKQQWTMWGYIVTSIMTKVLMDPCIIKYGVFGAVILYTGLMMILAIIFISIFSINIKKAEQL